MPIKTRVFQKQATRTSLPSIIEAVTADVNVFLASLPNLGDALDVQTRFVETWKAGDITYVVTIVYVES